MKTIKKNSPKEVKVKDLNPGDAFEYLGHPFIVIKVDCNVLSARSPYDVFVIDLSTNSTSWWGEGEEMVVPLPQLMVEAN